MRTFLVFGFCLVFVILCVNALREASTETADDVDEALTCKTVTFAKNQVEIVNGTLVIAELNVTFENYDVLETDEGVRVCFPFTDRFRQCDKWSMYREEYRVLPDNTLYVKPYKRRVDVGEYVIAEATAYVCVNEDNDALASAAKNAYRNMLKIYVVVSAAFLFAASVALTLKPKLRTSAWIQLFHVLSLFGASLLIVCHWYLVQTFNSLGCVLLALGIQWFVLAACSWLNVLSVHVYRNVTEPVKGNALLYALYAIVVPSALTGSALYVDRYMTDEETAFRPRFETQCWFNNRNAGILFFYGPVTVSVCVNVIVFVLIVWRQQNLALRGIISRSGIIKLIITYMKIFVVLGVFWMFEVVSWFLVNEPKLLINVLDTLTSLQGVFVFLVYDCHRFIYRSLCCKPGSDDADSDEGTAQSLDFERKSSFDKRESKQSVDVINWQKSIGFP